jgi:hypothetical protein
MCGRGNRTQLEATMFSSVHDVARYANIHVRYNILISRKLLYAATLWSQKFPISKLYYYFFFSHLLPSHGHNFGYIFKFLRIEKYRLTARQRLGKHIPAEANQRLNKTSIARQRIGKHASLIIEAVFCAVPADCL